MKLRFHRWTATVLVLLWVCAVAAVSAQRQPAVRRPPAAGPRQSEVQQLFDSYVAMQAQQALKLDDAQFGRFLPRLKVLQATRRRLAVERQRLVAELGRLSASAVVTLDEPLVRERLKTLSELDLRAPAELRAAYDALDQTLDVRQQARFRQFEQQVERRQFELMLQARRAQKSRLPR